MPSRLPMFVAIAMTAISATASPAQTVTRYVRFQAGDAIGYGILAGDTIHQLMGDLVASPRRTGKTIPLSQVKLVAPIVPKKVIAVGLNYQTHLGERSAATHPGLFAKMPSSIIGPEADIIYPADAHNLHYEGEMVVVIGKRASHVTRADADQYIFGITAGNDVSERDWQKTDLQWFRAKASDTFGPLGPVIVSGLNYDDLLLQTRLNGEVVQSQRTADLIFDVRTIVSYVSTYITLEPGDIIYTGTPGTTRPMKPGDVVEVELEGVGVLRNRVAAALTQ